MDALHISDAELLQRLESSEDSFVERKSLRDMRDVLKTCVAFANTCDVGGPPGIVFCPGRDDGTIENLGSPDSVQKTVKDKLSLVYPPITYKTSVIRRDGRNLLAVIVPGSVSGPHFSGPAYVREGSTTIAASEGLFARIVDRRERKVREILKWKDKQILMRRYVLNPASTQQRNPWAYSSARVIDCTGEWLHLEIGGFVPFQLDDVRLLGNSPQPPYALQIEVPQ